MTMQSVHSPKPRIFGKGYGAHLLYNFRLVKKFLSLATKLFINMLIPGVYYEIAHWEVIELYHKMRGFRHGTISDHRCPGCGGDLPSVDEMHLERDELKQLSIRQRLIEDFDRKMDAHHAEQKPAELHNEE